MLPTTHELLPTIIRESFSISYLIILQFYEASHGDTEASNDADTELTDATEVDDTSMATLMKALEVCALPSKVYLFVQVR